MLLLDISRQLLNPCRRHRTNENKTQPGNSGFSRQTADTCDKIRRARTREGLGVMFELGFFRILICILIIFLFYAFGD